MNYSDVFSKMMLIYKNEHNIHDYFKLPRHRDSFTRISAGKIPAVAPVINFSKTYCEARTFFI